MRKKRGFANKIVTSTTLFVYGDDVCFPSYLTENLPACLQLSSESQCTVALLQLPIYQRFRVPIVGRVLSFWQGEYRCAELCGDVRTGFFDVAQLLVDAVTAKWI